jgi:hypothetical protein
LATEVLAERPVLHAAFRAQAYELRDVQIVSTAADIPKDAELAIRLRVGATWKAIPFTLRDLPIRD